jgi:hypothetical protein
VTTGNHFFFDAISGAALVGVAYVGIKELERWGRARRLSEAASAVERGAMERGAVERGAVDRGAVEEAVTPDSGSTPSADRPVAREQADPAPAIQRSNIQQCRVRRTGSMGPATCETRQAHGRRPRALAGPLCHLPVKPPGNRGGQREIPL